MANPYVYGESYSGIGQQQMGLDAATAQRYFTSLAGNRQVQAQALAQRQQGIAMQMQAQQQADAQASRDQEGQYRMAALLQDIARRNQSDSIQREQTQYSRGRDTMSDLLNQQRTDFYQQGQTADRQLAQDKFNFTSTEPSQAEIRSRDMADRAAAEDARNMQIARNMANALNQQQGYANAANVHLPSVESAYNQGGAYKYWPDAWGGSANRDTAISNLATNIPPSVTPNPQALLSGKSFQDAFKIVKDLNDKEYQQQKIDVADLTRSGAMDWVTRLPSGEYVPNYVPRTKPQTNSPTAGAFSPQLQAMAQYESQGIPYTNALEMVMKQFPRKY